MARLIVSSSFDIINKRNNVRYKNIEIASDLLTASLLIEQKKSIIQLCLYELHLYANQSVSAWTLIGSTHLNLNSYYTKEEDSNDRKAEISIFKSIVDSLAWRKFSSMILRTVTISERKSCVMHKHFRTKWILNASLKVSSYKISPNLFSTILFS